MPGATQWTIRTGVETDIATAISLWRQAGGPPSRTDTESALRGLLGRDPDALLIASAGDEVIGSLIVAWDGWRGCFYRLAVHPDWRWRGIATELVRVGEERLKKLGAVRLTAVVIADDQAATAFWEAVGYRLQADACRFVRMLGES